MEHIDQIIKREMEVITYRRLRIEIGMMIVVGGLTATIIVRKTPVILIIDVLIVGLGDMVSSIAERD